MLQPVIINKLKKDIKNKEFENKSNLIKCLGDPTCLKILFIFNCEKLICPSDVSYILGISMPAVSHQLARLKQMGILENKRMGQMICYSFVNTTQAKLIRKLVGEII